MAALASGLSPVLAASAGLGIFQLAGSGCAERSHPAAHSERVAPATVVVAPVLNLSGRDVDSLKLTDTVASEFLSFPNISVIPVNLAVAALARRGKAYVESPEDALLLAREFGADATVVTAITEFDPYDPPVIGLIMQWYAEGRPPKSGGSRDADSPAGIELSAVVSAAPRYQVQRVFDGAREDVLREVRNFARDREGDEGPYGYRKVLQSQTLFARYCCRALIKPMLRLRESEFSAASADEAEP